MFNSGYYQYYDSIIDENCNGKIVTDFYPLDCFPQFEQVIPTCLKIGSINKIISKTDTLLTETAQLETELKK